MDNLPVDFKENDPRDEDYLNEVWLENKYERFYEGDEEVKQAIIDELRDNGWKEEAQYLEDNKLKPHGN